MRGITPVYHRILARGRRISAISAISDNGPVGVELTYGTVNGDIFADFVRGTLIPEMEPFNGNPKKSIVIMDNCSIHHIEKLLDDAGIMLISYSPDLNPIEAAFSSIKYYLKEHEEFLQTIPNPFAVIYSSFNDSITAENAKNGYKTVVMNKEIVYNNNYMNVYKIIVYYYDHTWLLLMERY